MCGFAPLRRTDPARARRGRRSRPAGRLCRPCPRAAGQLLWGGRGGGEVGAVRALGRTGHTVFWSLFCSPSVGSLYRSTSRGRAPLGCLAELAPHPRPSNPSCRICHVRYGFDLVELFIRFGCFVAEYEMDWLDAIQTNPGPKAAIRIQSNPGRTGRL